MYIYKLNYTIYIIYIYTLYILYILRVYMHCAISIMEYYMLRTYVCVHVHIYVYLYASPYT